MDKRIRRGPIIYNCVWCHTDIVSGEEFYVGDKEYTHDRPCATLYQNHWGTSEIPGPAVQELFNHLL